ncbi:MAG: hypothetical protein ACQEXV_22435 [Bacillota bacterium]
MENDTLKEILKMNTAFVPKSFSIEDLKKEVETFDIVDDDSTGSKYDEKMYYTLKGDPMVKTIETKYVPGIDKQARNELLDKMENYEPSAMKQHAELVKDVFPSKELSR